MPVRSNGCSPLLEDLQVKRQVAAKFIRLDHMQVGEGLTNQALRLFWREATAIAQLDHPAILSLYDHGEAVIDEISLAYLIMPYRPEGSLITWLRKRAQMEPSRPLTLSQVAHLVQQAGQALQYAHDHQVMHLDVKPANFLVRSRQDFDDAPDLLLSDFGIARLTNATSHTSQHVRGTPVYMAPEQCMGQPTFASDQYALAIMAYELLTGSPPFQGTPMQVMFAHIHEQPRPVRERNPLIPSAVDLTLLRALAKKPEERFPSIAAFAQAFQEALPGKLQVHPPHSTPSLQPTVQPTHLQRRDLVEQAQDLLKQKRYEEALNVFDQALQLDSHDAATFANKGSVLSQLGRHEEALAAYDNALRIDPGLSSTHHAKAETLMRLSRFHEAIQACNQAIRLVPNQVGPILTKGIAFLALQKHQEAIQTGDEALRLVPNNAYAYYIIGAALLGLQRFPEAFTVYDEAIRLAPNNVFYYTQKANALLVLQRYQEAIQVCDEALRIDLTSAETYTTKGIALFGLQRYQEALQACNEALSLDASDALAYSIKSGALNRLHRYEEALQASEQAIFLLSNDVDAYVRKGNALLGLMRQQEAIQAYDQALQLSPSALIYTHKAIALNELAKFDEALYACQQAFRLSPDYADAYIQAGNALVGLERLQEALEAYDEALRLNSSNVAYVYRQVCITFELLGRPQEARMAFEKARQFGYTGEYPVQITIVWESEKHR